MGEVVKLVTCLWLVFRGESGGDFESWRRNLHQTIVVNKMDTLKVLSVNARDPVFSKEENLKPVLFRSGYLRCFT